MGKGGDKWLIGDPDGLGARYEWVCIMVLSPSSCVVFGRYLTSPNLSLLIGVMVILVLLPIQ